MPKPTANAPRVLVVGGGIAGVVLATKLGQAGRTDVTLVDKSLSHVWKPTMHTIAAGTSSAERQRLSLLALAKRNGFTFWPGSLEEVDRDARRVALGPFAAPPPGEARAVAHALPYDALVLAVGSRANDFGTAGVAEHCWTVDDLVEAEDFRTRLRRSMFTAGDGRTVDVAIVGGGATGVELAAELKRAIDLVSGYGPPEMAHALRLTLLEAGPRLLPAFPAHIAAAATRTLTRLGIAVRTGATVTLADADGFTLEDGTRVAASLKVWAAGVKAPDVLVAHRGPGAIEDRPARRVGEAADHAGPRDLRARRLREPACRRRPPGAGNRPGGPPAGALPREPLGGHAGGAPVPAGAPRRGGEVTPFRYHDRGSIVSLSDYNGWGTFGHYAFGGGPLKGLSARWAHALLYRQHRFALLGAPRGAVDWLGRPPGGPRPPTRPARLKGGPTGGTRGRLAVRPARRPGPVAASKRPLRRLRRPWLRPWTPSWRPSAWARRAPRARALGGLRLLDVGGRLGGGETGSGAGSAATGSVFLLPRPAALARLERTAA